MILAQNSHIRKPPIILQPEQVVVFNAIRYSIDICEISFNRLIKNLSELSDNGNVDATSFPAIFLDVWSIINNSVIFKKIICRQFNISPKEEYLCEINKAISLRDSNQHIDERLSMQLLLNHLPIYGSLSWQKNYYETNEVMISAIYSGSISNKRGVGISISNKKGGQINEGISKIELSNIIRERTETKGNYTFREESLIISNIISELKWWVNHFEVQIEKQFEGIDTSQKHKSDLIIQFKGKLV